MDGLQFAVAAWFCGGKNTSSKADANGFRSLPTGYVSFSHDASRLHRVVYASVSLMHVSRRHPCCCCVQTSGPDRTNYLGHAFSGCNTHSGPVGAEKLEHGSSPSHDVFVMLRRLKACSYCKLLGCSTQACLCFLSGPLPYQKGV